jgi:hypothetical protein
LVACTIACSAFPALLLLTLALLLVLLLALLLALLGWLTAQVMFCSIHRLSDGSSASNVKPLPFSLHNMQQ